MGGIVNLSPACCVRSCFLKISCPDVCNPCCVNREREKRKAHCGPLSTFQALKSIMRIGVIAEAPPAATVTARYQKAIKESIRRLFLFVP